MNIILDIPEFSFQEKNLNKRFQKGGWFEQIKSKFTTDRSVAKYMISKGCDSFRIRFRRGHSNMTNERNPPPTRTAL